MSASAPRSPTGSRSNADPAELEKFEAMAQRWWDPAGEFRALHDINPLRLAWIEARAALHGRRVLDIGCGGGILSEAMAARGASVTGIDLSPAALEVARLHLHETGLSVDYRLESAESLADAQPDRYDIVTCLEMLEHVPQPSSVIAAAARLARPGGQLFFSTINRNPKAFLFAIVGAEYLLQLLPRGTHEYARFIKPSELGAWLRAADLELREFAGLHYNPLSGSYRLSANIDVNYLLHAERPGEI